MYGQSVWTKENMLEGIVVYIIKESRNITKVFRTVIMSCRTKNLKERIVALSNLALASIAERKSLSYFRFMKISVYVDVMCHF